MSVGMSDIDRLEYLVIGFGMSVLGRHDTGGWAIFFHALSTFFFIVYLLAVWIQFQRRMGE